MSALMPAMAMDPEAEGVMSRTENWTTRRLGKRLGYYIIKTDIAFFLYLLLLFPFSLRTYIFVIPVITINIKIIRSSLE